MRKKHETPEQVETEETLETIDDAAQEAEEVNPLEEQLKNAEKQRDEYLNLAQRVQADFDNFRRRNNAVRQEAFEDGAIAFIKTLLPVIDSIDLALTSAKDSNDPALRDGVTLIHTQLLEVLNKRGVSVIDRLGEKFDPNLENAVLQGTADEGEPGTVCGVFQKGYQTDKTVIRHAMVKVVAE